MLLIHGGLQLAALTAGRAAPTDSRLVAAFQARLARLAALDARQDLARATDLAS